MVKIHKKRSLMTLAVFIENVLIYELSGKTDPSEIETTISETADSVLLSLFMRINGKCNNSHAP